MDPGHIRNGLRKRRKILWLSEAKVNPVRSHSSDWVLLAVSSLLSSLFSPPQNKQHIPTSPSQRLQTNQVPS